jgi:hypothetical protein
LPSGEAEMADKTERDRTEPNQQRAPQRNDMRARRSVQSERDGKADADPLDEASLDAVMRDCPL